MTIDQPTWGRRLARSATAAVIAVLLAACGVTGPVGLTASETPAPETAAPSPSYESLKIDVFIDAESVTPVNKTFQVDLGETVVLVLRSDHDVSVQLRGPELDRSVYVARLSTITSSFVVDRPGTVTITTDDPEATVATLVVGQ
jgi:predicted small lipoprotein YifL